MISNTDHNDPNYDFYFNQAASEQVVFFFLFPVTEFLWWILLSNNRSVSQLQDKASYLNCCKQLLLLLSTLYDVIRREYLSSFFQGTANQQEVLLNSQKLKYLVSDSE